MLIYENSFPATYEEIKTWYPVWYREVFEMDAIWQVVGGQMDQIQADLVQMVENNFIEFADEPTITRLEAFFGIVHPFPRTLVERRAVLIGFVRGRGHIGRPQIIEIISLFTTGVIDVRFSRPGAIDVTVTRDFGDMFNLADIHMILGHRIPAHLTLGVVDLPQPVRVINQNDFTFIDLFMISFRVGNITAPQIVLNGQRNLYGTWQLGDGIAHGIDFIDFHVKVTIRNYGVVAKGVLLDGRNLLDGSVFLDGRKFGPLKGISAHQLDMGAFKIPNKFSVSSGVTFPIFNLTNSENFELADFAVHANIVNSGMVQKGILLNGQRPLNGTWPLSKWANLMSGLSTHNFNAGVYQFQNGNRLGAGLLEKSRPWGLDGEFALDGGLTAGGNQTLKKLTIKEAL
ncbi:MAG: YmfQ family protein [Defluviitaleaceae bacterium]|nr:YmfQ family protein [Defluviitaleaceae bacterium]